MRSDTVGGTAAASVIYFAGYQDDGVAFCGEALDQVHGVDFGAARPASAPAVRKQYEDIHRKSQPMAESVTLRGYASGGVGQKKNTWEMGMPLRLRSGFGSGKLNMTGGKRLKIAAVVVSHSCAQNAQEWGTRRPALHRSMLFCGATVAVAVVCWLAFVGRPAETSRAEHSELS